MRSMKGIFVALVLSGIIVAGCKPKHEVFVSSGGAINGYDPVAYFTENKSVKGDRSFSYEWNHAMWYFSSAENLEKFKNSPEQYAPQYGGYCAYGTAEGHKAPTDPEAWTIVDGKLYLNYNKDVKAKWFPNKTKLIQEADKNWPTVKIQDD